MTGIYAPQTQRYTVVGTLAEVRAVSANYGAEALVTNLGTSGTGVLVRWGSRGWRIPYDQPLLLDSTVAYSAATTAEVVAKQGTLPAGFNLLMSGMVVEVGWQKLGTASAASYCGLRIGSTGTTADTRVVNSVLMGAGDRSLSASRLMLFASNSSIITPGSQAVSTVDFGLTGNGAEYPVVANVNDMATTDTKISVCMRMAAATDQPGAYYLRVVGAA